MTETPKYSVLKKHKELELRRYSGYIQADVIVVEKHYKSTIEKGFNILAGYIFGNDISRKKIELTATVQAYQSEKIAMTIPVTGTVENRFTEGDFILAGYNSPWVPGFLARNEVIIKIK